MPNNVAFAGARAIELVRGLTSAERLPAKLTIDNKYYSATLNLLDYPADDSPALVAVEMSSTEELAILRWPEDIRLCYGGGEEVENWCLANQVEYVESGDVGRVREALECHRWATGSDDDQVQSRAGQDPCRPPDLVPGIDGMADRLCLGQDDLSLSAERIRELRQVGQTLDNESRKELASIAALALAAAWDI